VGKLVFSLVHVRRRPRGGSHGILLAGRQAIPVVLGRAGILANKREGDGATAALIEALAKRNDCRCLSIINKITLAIRPAFGNSTSLKEMNLAREF